MAKGREHRFEVKGFKFNTLGAYGSRFRVKGFGFEI